MLFCLCILLSKVLSFSVLPRNVFVLSIMIYGSYYSFLFFARHFSSFLSLAQELFSLLTLEYIPVQRLVHLPICSCLFGVTKRCKCVNLISIFIFDYKLYISSESTSQHFENFSLFSLLQICWFQISNFACVMAHIGSKVEVVS
jgi:hypothetical protein